MKILSRKEEIILLAVWKLQENAYGVTIREHVEKLTGVKWLFGAIYGPLGRLVDNRLVESFKSKPVAERGGRSKTMYRLTAKGKEALLAVQEINIVMWMDIPTLHQG